MTRPGGRVRALAARWCDAGAMARFIDPLIADWQAEDDEAARAGRAWRRGWLRVAYPLALAKVMASCEAARTWAVLRDPAHDDHRAIRRTIRLSATMMLIAITILVLPFVNEMGLLQPPSMFLYVIPQAIPLAIPVGLTIGIVWALGWSGVSRRVAVMMLAIAVASSAVSLATLAWVVPEANQAFRLERLQALAGRPRGDERDRREERRADGFRPARGVRELPMAELRRMLDAPETIPAGMRRAVAWTYYRYQAIAFAPAALTLFALCFARRGRRSRWQLGVAGAGAVWIYYALLWGARGADLDLTWSPFAAAWLANATFALWSLAYLRRTRLRLSPSAPGDSAPRTS